MGKAVALVVLEAAPPVRPAEQPVDGAGVGPEAFQLLGDGAAQAGGVLRRLLAQPGGGLAGGGAQRRPGERAVSVGQGGQQPGHGVGLAGAWPAGNDREAPRQGRPGRPVLEVGAAPAGCGREQPLQGRLDSGGRAGGRGGGAGFDQAAHQVLVPVVPLQVEPPALDHQGAAFIGAARQASARQRLHPFVRIGPREGVDRLRVPALYGDGPALGGEVDAYVAEAGAPHRQGGRQGGPRVLLAAQAGGGRGGVDVEGRQDAGFVEERRQAGGADHHPAVGGGRVEQIQAGGPGFRGHPLILLLIPLVLLRLRRRDR